MNNDGSSIKPLSVNLLCSAAPQQASKQTNMQFSIKFATIFLAIATTAQARLAARKTEQISVILFDDTNLRGASFSPDGLLQSVCSTLPSDWLDRAESVQISPGFSCIFFGFQGCEGAGTTLSGIVDSLPDPALYNNVESLLCTKIVA